MAERREGYQFGFNDVSPEFPMPEVHSQYKVFGIESIVGISPEETEGKSRKELRNTPILTVESGVFPVPYELNDPFGQHVPAPERDKLLYDHCIEIFAAMGITAEYLASEGIISACREISSKNKAEVHGGDNLRVKTKIFNLITGLSFRQDEEVLAADGTAILASISSIDFSMTDTVKNTFEIPEWVVNQMSVAPVAFQVS